MNWEMSKKCYESPNGYWYAETNVESTNGIDITVKLFRRFKTKKTAEKAMDKILNKINFKAMEAI